MQTHFGESFPRPAPEDLAACRRLLKTGSRSFHAAAQLLPARCRDAATALYAFCRIADDAIDEGDDPRAALAELYRRLDAIYAGHPEPEAADRAFCPVAVRHGIPRGLPAALLEGFAWDAEGRRYATLSELTDYASRVAGTVGVMMALLMGQRDTSVLARAADMGVAMQLTNIARDVGEDARAGRLYLPLDWLREAGIDPDEFLARPVFSDGVRTVVQRLLAEADRLYARADAGLVCLPLKCRPGMYAARLLYSGIGHRLLANGGDSVSVRTVVPPLRKLQRLLRVPAVFFLRRRALAAPVLPENAYLVDSVASHGQPRFSSLVHAEGKLAWMLGLLMELEQRETGSRFNKDQLS
jgi:phytoene synthase